MRSVAMPHRSDYDYAAQDAQVPGRRRIRLIALYPEAIMHSPHPVARSRLGASTSTSTNTNEASPDRSRLSKKNEDAQRYNATP